MLYSHRSTVLHAYAVISPDACGLRATDRVLPVAPMFHVNAWGTPYAAPMVGASLIMSRQHLDGASLSAMMNEEKVTMSAGVPTVWMGLLQHLRSTGTRLDTVERLHIGGSACPRVLIEAFEHEYGARIYQGWGMTETSPAAVVNRPKPANQALAGEEGIHLREKQDRAVFGIETRIVDDVGTPLPWDGQAPGRLMVRGPWVCGAYFGDPPGTACDAEGWLDTGDIATIDPEGYLEITDRAKDVVKSGGEWISSVLLENIAVSHPDVAEAAVIAARHLT